MMTQTLAIPLGFILLAALLCWWIIGTKGAWWKKLLAILLVPTFGIAVWRALPSYLGWPTPDRLPDKSLLLWAAVREPEPKAEDPGAIYLLLRPLAEKEKSGMVLLDYAEPKGEPRLYKMPYSRKMHEAMQSAEGMIRDGKPVVLDMTGGAQGAGNGRPGQGRPGGPGGGPGGEGSNGYGGDPDRRDPQIYELPPPHPPEKRPE